MDGLFGLILIVILLAIYFLPAIVALGREKRNKNAILLLNIFLGWTLVGWVVALVWSAMDENDRE